MIIFAIILKHIQYAKNQIIATENSTILFIIGNAKRFLSRKGTHNGINIGHFRIDKSGHSQHAGEVFVFEN